MMTWTPALCWTPGPSHTRLMDLASSWEICHVSITRQPSNYLIQQQTWRIALLQANTNLGNKQQNIMLTIQAEASQPQLTRNYQ